LAAWPVEGRLSQPFGCSPFYTGLTGPGCPAERPWFHDGIDLAVSAGMPVRAALTGTVIFAGPDGSGPACGDYRGYGLGVVIDDGGEWQVLYAHLSQIEVGVGQVVTPATVIGTSGATGCVSGPHLHFGLRHQENLVDPLAYLPGRDETAGEKGPSGSQEERIGQP
jgi:murein DD-endopeptidase MepM/ murein hydrolase activator NlpD